MRLNDILVKCDRCAAEVRLADAPDDWNTEFRNGYIVGHLCPDCQTPEEHIEAEVNASTVDYSKASVDHQGRALAGMKVWLPSTGEEIARDLFERVETAMTKIAIQVQLTGKGAPKNAIVNAVEDNLPPGYPNFTSPLGLTRRDLIKEIIKDIIDDLEGGDAA